MSISSILKYIMSIAFYFLSNFNVKKNKVLTIKNKGSHTVVNPHLAIKRESHWYEFLK